MRMITRKRYTSLLTEPHSYEVLARTYKLLRAHRNYRGMRRTFLFSELLERSFLHEGSAGDLVHKKWNVTVTRTYPKLADSVSAHTSAQTAALPTVLAFSRSPLRCRYAWVALSRSVLRCRYAWVSLSRSYLRWTNIPEPADSASAMKAKPRILS